MVQVQKFQMVIEGEGEAGSGSGIAIEVMAGAFVAQLRKVGHAITGAQLRVQGDEPPQPPQPEHPEEMAPAESVPEEAAVAEAEPTP